MLTFRDKRVCVSHEAVSKLPHEAFHVVTKPTMNADSKTTGATIYLQVITCSQKQLALQFATTMKKERKKKKIASHLHTKSKREIRRER